MMKKIGILTGVVALVILASCSKVRRSPGRAYMPDMAYSRAVETYSSTEGLKQKGINYTALPVAGTIARGDMLFQYPYKNDSTGYKSSAAVKNPLPKLDARQYLEAARLYLVNCGICHGEKLDGNGPLWKDGNGPYPAAPKNLMGNDMKALPEGTMFHVATYGKGAMGSYASQLNTEQRWMVVHYIKEKQGLTGNDSVTTNVSDTTVKKGK
ncbi:MAG TPA: cytochrome c [Chitinophagaceae bacterium]|nr:cytochrome c [Chitinophagaceae bacterium]